MDEDQKSKQAMQPKKKIHINEILSRPPVKISEAIAKRRAAQIYRKRESHKDVYDLSTFFLKALFFIQTHLLPAYKKNIKGGKPTEIQPVVLWDLLNRKFGITNGKKIKDNIIKRLQRPIFNDNPLIKEEKGQMIATYFHRHFKCWQGLIHVLTTEIHLKRMKAKEWCEIMHNTFKLDCNQDTFKQNIIDKMKHNIDYTKPFRNFLKL